MEAIVVFCARSGAVTTHCGAAAADLCAVMAEANVSYVPGDTQSARACKADEPEAHLSVPRSGGSSADSGVVDLA